MANRFSRLTDIRRTYGEPLGRDPIWACPVKGCPFEVEDQRPGTCPKHPMETLVEVAR